MASRSMARHLILRILYLGGLFDEAAVCQLQVWLIQLLTRQEMAGNGSASIQCLPNCKAHRNRKIISC